MGKRLQTVESHVTDITISTATVDIQVVRIGTKQMTLAVFRQLPSMDILDKKGELVAPPWGWVNYETTGGEYGPFIFSYKDILYRCHVDWYRYRFSPAAVAMLVYRDETGQEIDAEYYRQYSWRFTYGNPKSPTLAEFYWCLVDRRNGRAYRNPLQLTFESEADAHAYLANLHNSLATLRSAPQLFIGV